MRRNPRHIIYPGLLLLILIGSVYYLPANIFFNLFKGSKLVEADQTSHDDGPEKRLASDHEDRALRGPVSFKSEGFTKEKLITGEGGFVELNGARLEVPDQSLKAAINISITALTEFELPPLDLGLINVTANHSGFRFLPHGTHFEKQANVILPYDETLVPAGYGIEDINTYFFNEATGHWESLQKLSEDRETAKINSLTTHFTDMINGIIRVPEMPKTHAYAPTSIKDLKPANPADEIITIGAPSANHLGNLLLAYPLKLPAGRKGMQPDLSIQYNSEINNGWLGAGWNLMLPQIALETRWGAPRFKADVETETYLLNGEQLGSVAHRGLAVSRTSEKQFHQRVENSFQKIIRHGDHPANYWWEVTEKNGKRHFYGGNPEQGMYPAAVLTDASGNIAHWALAETRDLNHNFIKYHYQKISDTGIPGGVVPGYQLYIDRITYTGHLAEEGKYSVLFTTDRELSEAKRKDVIINARLGFKQVTADLLRKIEIQYNGINIRSYELRYTEGAFFKMLLQSIIEFNAAGAEFSRHQIGYYDDVRKLGAYHPFETQQIWQPQNDAIGGNFLNPTTLFGDHASALGASKSSGFSAGLTVTAGPFDFLLFTKTNTAGASFGYANHNNEGLLALVDINGDALPDKLFKQNGQLYYRPNESGSGGQLRFGTRRLITGISDFDKGKSRTLEAGIESNFVIYAGVQYSNTKNERSTYFADANGDQLMDIVNQGTVFFNHIGADGNPYFNNSSAGTPSPIQSLSTVDDSLVVIDSAELAQLEKDNPLHDVVKIWKAPYNGVIGIFNPVQLLEDISPERQGYTSADGVRVSIQHNSGELWSAVIDDDDYVPVFPAGVSSISVNRGDQIYFRVQSNYDGAYDQVIWNPTITYTSHVPGLDDANGFPIYEFTASSDFLASTAMSVGMPINGEVQISGVLVKPVTSDDIHIEIVRKTTTTEQVIWQNDLLWDSVSFETISLTQVVGKGDDLFFRVGSSSNIKWSDLSWMPRVYYISSSDTSITDVTNSQGQPIIDFYPVVEYRIYNKDFHPSQPWIAPVADTFSFSPIFSLDPSNNQSGDVTFSIKKKNILLAKKTIQVTPGGSTGTAPVNLVLNQGDSLYLEYHTRNEDLWNFVSSAQTEITGGATATITAGAHVYSEASHRFGSMYRNWGQFVYNGNGDLATMPIIEANLVIDSSLTNPDTIDLSTAGDEQEMQDMYNNGNGNTPNDDKFVYMIPSASENSWKGYDNFTYVTPTVISSSRMGDDDLLPINPVDGSSGPGAGAKAIKKISITHNISVAAGLGLGGSYSTGWTNQVYEYMDVNGDRYPDLLSKNKIQYTLPFGGLDAKATPFVYGEVEQTGHHAFGITAGGTFVSSATFNSKKDNKGSKSASASAKGKASASISGNFNFNYDSTSTGWVDINGDGLTDRVHRNGGVELNLGYKFAPVENWGFLGIAEGNTISYGGGIGINISNYSIAAGVGLSRSENNLNKTLRDVNGDGLPDYITDHPLDVVVDTHPLMVSLNTGNGFAPPVEWTGANSINEDISTGESANIAFTVCVPITPIVPVAKVCFNPSTSVTHGVSREKIEIMDIDGDEYPDFLESDKDSDLKIKRSSIRRTNLLKSVTRPMGGGFVVDYERTGNTAKMPNSMWVLSGVEVFDGVVGDGADYTFTSFTYAGGYYDRHEREFYGFKNVKINEHDTRDSNVLYRSRVKEFANSNYYEKGLILAEHIQDSSGNKYNETISRYELKNIQTGADLPPGSELSDRAEAFPALAETRMLIYEGQSIAAKTTRMQYHYDALGNIISETDFGGPEVSDDFTTQTNYYALANVYLMNIPKSVVVSNGSQIFRKREQDLNLSSGDITEIRNFSAPAVASIHNMQYDAFGNLVQIIHPQNANGHRLSYTYQYDPDINTFVTRVQDSYGYVSSSVYDLRFGKPISITDINNQRTRYTLDDAGRTSTITGPQELAAAVPYTIAFEYHPDAIVPWALTKHYDQDNPGNFIETAVFMDGLQRPIQLKKDGSLFTSPWGVDQEMMLVSGAIIFDAFGREAQNFYPITEAKGNEGIYNSVRDTIAPTQVTYDVLDRAEKKVLPDGATSHTQYGFGTDRNGLIQCRRLATDANGIKEETFTNSRGLSTSSRRIFSQGSDIWTSYEYNAINELKKLIDDKRDSIVSEYDWLGRKIALKHPDAGRTTFEYDRAGLLVKKKTANLQGTSKSIRYFYDRERLVKILYPDNPENNVEYHYGSVNSPYNRAGRVKVQEDATGGQEFFYDAFGNTTKIIRTIIVPHDGWNTYKTEWKYDAWNRLQEMVYPDGERLEYDYNPGGLLSTMKGKKDYKTYHYMKRLGYDKFENRVYMKYGNNTETFYAYETKRRRLSRVMTETEDNRKMMDISYTYDQENNLLDLVNNGEIPSKNKMGGRGEYHFTYDDLYRLTGASGYFKGRKKEHRFTVSMKYGSTGNILEKEQDHESKSGNSNHWHTENETTYSEIYKYNADQPHAPDKIGHLYYQYDANGNQTGWQTHYHPYQGHKRRIWWDEENRISAIADNGAMFTYTYDADGERVLKSRGGHHRVSVNGNPAAKGGGSGNHTIYVNQWYVVENGSVTKHFFAGNERILVKEGDKKQGGNHYNRTSEAGAGSSAEVEINYAQKESGARTIISKLYLESDIELPEVRKTSAVNVEGGNGDTDPGQRSGDNDHHHHEPDQYYFHLDHLGSSSFVTDAEGEPIQHIEYFPFGETFLEEQTNDHTHYLYTSKETDDETGLYYYGGRYYDTRTSVWESADPKKEEFPAWSPYSYSFQNPINFNDPDGREPEAIIKQIEGTGYVKAAAVFFGSFSKTFTYSFDHIKNRVFWSGGPEAMNAALGFAKANESITLEMTTEGQDLAATTQKIGFERTEGFWKQISSGYAKGATGKVNVFRKLILRPGNIWEGQEKKILDNKKVPYQQHTVEPASP